MNATGYAALDGLIKRLVCQIHRKNTVTQFIAISKNSLPLLKIWLFAYDVLSSKTYLGLTQRVGRGTELNSIPKIPLLDDQKAGEQIV